MVVSLQKFKYVISAEGLHFSLPFCCSSPNSLSFVSTVFLITLYTHEILWVIVSWLATLTWEKSSWLSIMPPYLLILWAHSPWTRMFLEAESILSLKIRGKLTCPTSFHLVCEFLDTYVLMVTSRNNLFFWTIDFTQVSLLFRSSSLSPWHLPRHGTQCFFFAHLKIPYAKGIVNNRFITAQQRILKSSYQSLLSFINGSPRESPPCCHIALTSTILFLMSPLYLITQYLFVSQAEEFSYLLVSQFSSKSWLGLTFGHLNHCVLLHSSPWFRTG